eukprot:709099-Ditylum_brightwellii.AAC.1
MKLDEEYTSSDSASSLEDTRKVGTNRVVRKNRSEPTLDDSNEFCHNTILDSGAEKTILGGPAWSIIKRSNHLLNMSAVDNTMSGVAMQLSVKREVYSLTLTDDEAVINTYFIQEAGWQVDCVAKCHGRSQSIWFPNGDDVPLEYSATKCKLFAKCCHPTPME